MVWPPNKRPRAAPCPPNVAIRRQSKLLPELGRVIARQNGPLVLEPSNELLGREHRYGFRPGCVPRAARKQRSSFSRRLPHQPRTSLHQSEIQGTSPRTGTTAIEQPAPLSGSSTGQSPKSILEDAPPLYAFTTGVTSYKAPIHSTSASALSGIRLFLAGVLEAFGGLVRFQCRHDTASRGSTS
ncbi:MAG: hypothetical protein JWR51_70 [Devosia sp.]|nr:hypothetical protein [Devosia sp.]